MKKALGYERYSCQSQSETSIVVQKNAIENYCLKNNIRLIKHYSDYAISGKNADTRPEFKKELEYSLIYPIEIDDIKIFVIDDGNHNTMLISSEY